MKANSSLPNLCPNCGEKLEQFLVTPIFSASDNQLQAINVACPYCRVGAEITIAELTQALLQRAATEVAETRRAV